MLQEIEALTTDFGEKNEPGNNNKKNSKQRNNNNKPKAEKKEN